MLVNTNDAFTGINAHDLDDLAVGEGFNAARDDLDIVRMHSGVVSKDDGLNSSVLTEQARFENTVMRVSIRRTR